MRWFRWRAILLLAVFLVGWGCGGRTEHKPRPRAGDCVTPLIREAGPWISGQVARFAIQVQANNQEGSDAALLTNDDVPESILPQLTVTFFRGEELLRVDPQPALERFC